jgi:hypothetical protein
MRFDKSKSQNYRKEESHMDNTKDLLNGNMKPEDLDAAIARLDSAIISINDRLEKNRSLAAKTEKTSDIFKKKIIAMVASVGVLIFSLTVCTYAYFTSTSYSSDNKIASGKPSVTLSGTSSSDPGSINMTIFPGQTVENTVFARNDGAIPVYIRAKVNSEITLHQTYSDRQNEVDLSLVSFDFDASNWTLMDGYYYYNNPIGYKEATTNLISNVIFSTEMGNIYKDSTIKVTIMLESVQANNNGNSVFDAMGWAPAQEGGAD